jgi:hypothetical protein
MTHACVDMLVDVAGSDGWTLAATLHLRCLYRAGRGAEARALAQPPSQKERSEASLPFGDMW